MARGSTRWLPGSPGLHPSATDSIFTASRGNFDPLGRPVLYQAASVVPQTGHHHVHHHYHYHYHHNDGNNGRSPPSAWRRPRDGQNMDYSRHPRPRSTSTDPQQSSQSSRMEQWQGHQLYPSTHKVRIQVPQIRTTRPCRQGASAR